MGCVLLFVFGWGVVVCEGSTPSEKGHMGIL